MTESLSVGALVAALPEKYQPIFAHPELSDGSSRSCEDRLVLIRECARQLQEVVGRPLRVLDLGCAQGFFSLSLAADGHRVHGVDFLDLNVHVCEALAKQNPKFEATFEHGTVEDVIEKLEPGEYDLVLGLSVFHHLVHARGVVSVSALCRKLSEVAGAGIFELALREEPLYWAPSLPHDPAELLSSYAFTRLLSRQPTHLSTISRPLIFASSRFWYVGESVGEFTSWSSESHAHGRGTHQHSRRYYFGEQVFVKKMTLGLGGRAEINLQEFQNEVAFLRNPPASYPAAPLIEALNDSSDLFLVRAMMEGRLLSELIDEGVPYDADQVLSELLDQLVVLEGEGLYHNDVRCWNVLISGDGRALLIDYGAISSDAKDCSWLEDLLLSFLITTREILERRIVPSNPGREPALDFTSLPPRYRNAFLLMFSQDPSRWTYAGLRDCFVHSEAVASPAPEWTSIYQHLQGALVSYNTRLSSLYAQTEHDRVELAARGAALERVREIALHAEEELVTLKVEAEAADKTRLALEESGRLLADWAKELEEHAVKSDAELKVEMEAAEMRSRGHEESRRLLIERAEELEAQATESEARATQMVARVAELEVDGQQMTERVAELEAEGQQMTGRIAELKADGQQMTGRMAELEADGQQMTERVAELEADGEQMVERMAELVAVNGTLVTQIVELDLELDELQCAREAAEVRAAEVGPLTGERDALLVKLSDGQRVEEQHEATAHYLRGEATSLLHRIERLERSRAHDRRRLKELQADLSQGVQTMGSSRARVRELEMAVEALEAQIDSVYASRSWRVTAPLRWFTNKVLKRGDATPVPLDAATQRSSTKVVRGDVPSPADAAVEKRLAALDQLASRIRKSRQ